MLDLKSLILPHLAALKRRRWQALGIAWAICLAGWAAIATLPDRYEAKARLYVDTETILGPLMQGLAVAPDFARQVDMMRRTLLSVPNVEELIRMTNLDYRVTNQLEQVQLIERLQKSIEVKNQGPSLFQISYVHAEPEVAQRVVDSILQIFVEQNLGHSQRDVETARDFIDRQIDDYEEKLREAELAVSEFRQLHAAELGGAGSNRRKLEQKEEEIRRLNAELQSAAWRRDQIQAQLDTTPRKVAQTQLQSGEPSVAERQLQALRQELDNKLLIYTEQHPEILGLRQLIGQIEARVDANGGSAGGGGVVQVDNPAFQRLTEALRLIGLQMEDLERRLVLAQQEIEPLYKTATAVPEVEVDLTRLTRDYDVLLAQDESLIQRRESATIARDLDTGVRRIEYRVIDPPTVPLQPIGPPRGLYMGLVLLVGFAAGIAYAIGQQLISGSFLTVSQIKSFYEDLPILGGVTEARGAAGGGGFKGAEWAGVASGSVALVGFFVLLFYAVSVSSFRPDVAGLVVDLKELLGRQIGTVL
jgi:polysaccharide chain length determinant protein (PEP-CTERM system associated)